MDAEETTEKAQEWHSAASETADELKHRAQDWKQTACETREAIDRYVRENAWMSIATVALVGCAIGFLLGRRRD